MSCLKRYQLKSSANALITACIVLQCQIKIAQKILEYEKFVSIVDDAFKLGAQDNMLISR